MANNPVQAVTFGCGHRRFYTGRDLIDQTRSGRDRWDERAKRWVKIDPMVVESTGDNAYTCAEDCCHCRAGMLPPELEPTKRAGYGREPIGGMLRGTGLAGLAAAVALGGGLRGRR